MYRLRTLSLVSYIHRHVSIAAYLDSLVCCSRMTHAVSQEIFLFLLMHDSHTPFPTPLYLRTDYSENPQPQLIIIVVSDISIMMMIYLNVQDHRHLLYLLLPVLIASCTPNGHALTIPSLGIPLLCRIIALPSLDLLLGTNSREYTIPTSFLMYF